MAKQKEPVPPFARARDDFYESLKTFTDKVNLHLALVNTVISMDLIDPKVKDKIKASVAEVQKAWTGDE